MYAWREKQENDIESWLYHDSNDVPNSGSKMSKKYSTHN